MQSMRSWLFETVAHEITMHGLHGLNIKNLASNAGLSGERTRELYPNHRSLMFALVDEIGRAHQEFALSPTGEPDNARLRITRFITRSLEFAEEHPTLAEIMVIALLGTDPAVKERVIDNYERFFNKIMDDFVDAGIIPARSLAHLAELTEILLSIVYLGGCPKLQMDYLSFVDLHKVAVSTVNGIQQYMQYSSH